MIVFKRFDYGNNIKDPKLVWSLDGMNQPSTL